MTDQPDALRRIGILPELEEQDPDDLTPEQLREVVRKQKRQLELDRQDIISLRQQKSQKRSHSPNRMASRSTNDLAEVVDLT